MKRLIDPLQRGRLQTTFWPDDLHRAHETWDFDEPRAIATKVFGRSIYQHIDIHEITEISLAHTRLSVGENRSFDW